MSSEREHGEFDARIAALEKAVDNLALKVDKLLDFRGTVVGVVTGVSTVISAVVAIVAIWLKRL